jgi:hypothetical protein
MNVREAAAEIGLSADAIYDLCARGMLGHRRVGAGRGRIQILPSHVAAYLASCEVPVVGRQEAAQSPTAKRKLIRTPPDGQPFRWMRKRAQS